VTLFLINSKVYSHCIFWYIYC